jgi:hypothetical protein
MNEPGKLSEGVGGKAWQCTLVCQFLLVERWLHKLLHTGGIVAESEDKASTMMRVQNHG